MISYYFDTSVLIAALVAGHPDHARSFAYLEATLGGQAKLVTATHTLAELYATLTRLPLSPKIKPAQARQLIEVNVTRHGSLVALDAKDYLEVLARMAKLGLESGAIYDGLHVRAAEKAGAVQLLTLNARDFERMPPAQPTALLLL